MTSEVLRRVARHEQDGEARPAGFQAPCHLGPTDPRHHQVEEDEVGGQLEGGLQGLLMRKLAVAADGAIAIVNSSFREGEISRVRLICGRVDQPESRGQVTTRSSPK